MTTVRNQVINYLRMCIFLQLTRTGWTVWTTRDDRTSLSSPTLPAGGNELSISVTSSQLISVVINVGQKDPQLWTDSEQPWLEGFYPSPPLLFILSFSPLQSASQMFLWIPFQRELPDKITFCPPRWSELWCDPLLCNVPLKAGASPVDCCALTRVGRTKLS